jgi:hypothetical protein
MLTDAEKNDIRGVALAIMPELAARPLYVLSGDETEEQLPSASFDCVHGFSLQGKSTAAYADAIGRQWQGIGSLIMVRDVEIEKTTTPAGRWSAILRVAVHEVAHKRSPAPLCPPDYTPSKAFNKAATTFFAASAERLLQDPRPDESHSADFIRRCCHCAYRAIVKGYELGPLSGLFGGTVWPWVCQPEYYLHRLLPELAKFAGEPMATIEATPAPAAFTKLWEADLRDYQRSLAERY